MKIFGFLRFGFVRFALFGFALIFIACAPKESQLAQIISESQCDYDFDFGCTRLGIRYYEMGEFDKARELLADNCKETQFGFNNTGCYHLGLMYAQGFGVAKDIAKAEDLWERVCDTNYALNFDFCENLVRIYENGDNIVSRDIAKARYFTGGLCESHKGANVGNAEIQASRCMNLARIYENGDEITPKNFAQALYYYGIACDYNHIKEACEKVKPMREEACANNSYISCVRLGGQIQLYEPDRAKSYYKKACDADLADGCEVLAHFYFYQLKDYENAKIYYQKACDLGGGADNHQKLVCDKVVECENNLYEINEAKEREKRKNNKKGQ